MFLSVEIWSIFSIMRRLSNEKKNRFEYRFCWGRFVYTIISILVVCVSVFFSLERYILPGKQIKHWKWNKCKPYFSNNQSKNDSNITLIEKNELLLKNTKVSDVFSSYLQSIINSLDLFEWPLRWTDQIYDRVDRIIDSLCFHPSIKNIKRNYKITNKFSFKPVFEDFVKNIVNDLSSNKADGGEIPLKILKKCGFSFHF